MPRMEESLIQKSHEPQWRSVGVKWDKKKGKRLGRTLQNNTQRRDEWEMKVGNAGEQRGTREVRSSASLHILERVFRQQRPHPNSAKTQRHSHVIHQPAVHIMVILINRQRIQRTRQGRPDRTHDRYRHLGQSIRSSQRSFVGCCCGDEDEHRTWNGQATVSDAQVVIQFLRSGRTVTHADQHRQRHLKPDHNPYLHSQSTTAFDGIPCQMVDNGEQREARNSSGRSYQIHLFHTKVVCHP